MTEAFADTAASGGEPRRGVEAEIRMPKFSEMSLPRVNLEPLKSLAEDMLLTSLGVGGLLVRGVGKALEAAHQAGEEAAEKPGSLAEGIVGVFRGKPAPVAPASARPSQAGFRARE